jgi:hypothetical protein
MVGLMTLLPKKDSNEQVGSSQEMDKISEVAPNEGYMDHTAAVHANTNRDPPTICPLYNQMLKRT